MRVCRRFRDILPKSNVVALRFRELFGNSGTASRMHDRMEKDFTGLLHLRLCDPAQMLLKSLHCSPTLVRIQSLVCVCLCVSLPVGTGHEEVGFHQQGSWRTKRILHRH